MERKSALAMLRESILFNLLTRRLEALGFHWKEDKRKPAGGYFEVYMPGTGCEWRSYVSKGYWIIVPLEKLPGVKQIHYSFPFPLGIWFHRTILWEGRGKAHNKFKIRTTFLLRKYDIIKDYLELKKQLSEQP